MPKIDIHSAKAILLRQPLVAKLNASFKARKLKIELAQLRRHYASLAIERNFNYSREEAVGLFKARRAKLLGQEPKAKLKPRIFWVGANRDQDESGFLQALREIADVVTFMNWQGTYGQWYWDEKGRVKVFDPLIIEKNDSAFLEQVSKEHEENPFDLILGQMWANYLSIGAITKVRQMGIPIINVSMDDRLPDNWKSRGNVRLGAIGLGPATDMVLTTCNETCTWYGLEGCPALFWPLASDPKVFASNTAIDRDIDVLFVGNKYGIREKIVSFLEGEQIEVQCFGAGWRNGPVSAEESAALSKRAKIILGVGTVGHCDDVFTMKLRDFDAPMSGALYLTHRGPDITALYEEGKEFECYMEPQEAAEKIKFYLKNSKERIAVSEAGQAKAMSRDTWALRFRSTLSELGFISV